MMVVFVVLVPGGDLRGRLFGRVSSGNVVPMLGGPVGVSLWRVSSGGNV